MAATLLRPGSVVGRQAPLGPTSGGRRWRTELRGTGCGGQQGTVLHEPSQAKHFDLFLEEFSFSDPTSSLKTEINGDTVFMNLVLNVLDLYG